MAENPKISERERAASRVREMELESEREIEDTDDVDPNDVAEVRRWRIEAQARNQVRQEDGPNT